MDEVIKLLPCPFCGAPARYDAPSEHNWNCASVACDNPCCRVKPHSCVEKGPEQAIAAWNARNHNSWQDIATAPKDGTRVLLWIESTKIAMPFEWNGERWMGDDYPLNMAWPTHWMPMPDPPALDRIKDQSHGG